MTNTGKMMFVVMWLVMYAVATPVRRSPDLEARRRSAIDRSLVRFGRSYPKELSAADVREAFQRPARRGNSFLRFGRSQTVNVPQEDLLTLLKSYDDNYEDPAKRSASFVRFGRDPSFIRLGRDPSFIRLGRSGNDDQPTLQEPLNLNGYPQRKGRARDLFLRLGRDSEELNEGNESDGEFEESRNKRSTDADCQDCRS